MLLAKKPGREPSCLFATGLAYLMEISDDNETFACNRQGGRTVADHQRNEFIAKLVKDPKNPPKIQQISGFLGDAAEPGRTRIYLDTGLQHWVEVVSDKILHVEPMKIDGQPPSSVVWVTIDTPIYPSSHAPRVDAGAYFGGALYHDYMAHARDPHRSGEAKFQPADSSFICGSFAACTGPTREFNCTSMFGSCK
jgi:hypothetical protein